MYKITTESSFDAAHFLKDYPGKCSNIHGHRWRVVASFATLELQEGEAERGMVMDFGRIKEILNILTDRLDHTFVYERGSMSQELIDLLCKEGFALTEVAFRPTAENFAKYFYDFLAQVNLPVYDVTVYETPNNQATYSKLQGED